MRKRLKILLPIIAIIIIIIFLFKNDFMLWRVANQYKTDPSSIDLYADIPEVICEDARKEILNAYLEKPTTSEENLAATVELIEFFRSCVSKSSPKDKTPLYKKSFDVLMDIYERTKKVDIHCEIASFLKKEDTEAFYRYFEMTQRNDLPFYDGIVPLPVKYPKLSNEPSIVEKELWCKNVQPKVEADFIALLESDTLKNGVTRLQLLTIYEKTNCNNDMLHLRKIQFSAWSKLLANLENKRGPFQNKEDINNLRNAAHKLNREAKNELEATSLFSLLSMSIIPDDLENESQKKLLLHLLDSPIESRVMCLDLVFYLCHEYSKNPTDDDVVIKTKEWLKLVDQKYPKLAIEKEWQHQVDLEKLSVYLRKEIL